MTLLQANGVTRRFGGLTAVGDVNLDVEAGTVHGLIGPNGAGKTTLLNMLSGHLVPTSGSLRLDGRDITRMRPAGRAAAGIRRTFQNLKLFREMTALENVMVGCHTRSGAEIVQALLRTRAQRREEAGIDAAARAALAFVGLPDAADQLAGSLPYGHQRLLEIARAVVAEPRLLLLDEPAAGLNAAESRRLVGLIRAIRGRGITVVLVEHHMDVVMPTCDAITVLHHGRRLAQGTPSFIRSHPEVVQAYLGASARPRHPTGAVDAAA